MKYKKVINFILFLFFATGCKNKIDNNIFFGISNFSTATDCNYQAYLEIAIPINPEIELNYKEMDYCTISRYPIIGYIYLNNKDSIELLLNSSFGRHNLKKKLNSFGKESSYIICFINLIDLVGYSLSNLDSIAQDLKIKKVKFQVKNIKYECLINLSNMNFLYFFDNVSVTNKDSTYYKKMIFFPPLKRSPILK